MPARFELRWRRALLDAALPAPPGGGLPAMADLDLTPFWLRFGQTAPLHLRLGLRAATWLLGGLWPLLRHLRTFPRLDAARQQRLLRGAMAGRLLGPLAEVLKLIACLAYFHDDGVQRRVRGGPP